MNSLLALHLVESTFDFTTMIEERQGLIFLLSSIISLIFAVAMLAPFRRGAIEKWAQYFGGGFAFFFVQYAIRCVAHLLVGHELVDPAYYQTVKIVAHVAVLVCSEGNNLMFLAAALTLMGRDSPFPTPALIIAGISLIGAFDATSWRPDAVSTYYRLFTIPDAIFSATCFGAIGYATATSIFYRKFPLLSLLSVLVGTFYAFIQIIYGLGPFIFDSVWINHYFHIKGSFGSIERLNAILFGLALLFKFLLFLPGYILHQRSLTAFYDIQDMLKNVVEGRDEFISHDGIVSVIGHRFSANLVDLSIKLPGKERVASFIWDSDIPEEERKKVAIVKNIESSSAGETKERIVDALIRWGLSRNKPFMFPQKKSAFRVYARKIYRQLSALMRKKQAEPIHDTELPEDVKAVVEGKKALMLIPVQFHGATIGCIKIERSQPSYRLAGIALYLPFSNSALSLAKKICDLAAPSVQAHRELAALDRLSLKFAQTLSGAERSVKLLAEILQDSLTPEAMRFVLDFGFNQSPAVDTGDAKYVELLRENIGNKGYNDLPTYMEGPGGNCFKLYKRELLARVSENKPAGTRSLWKQFRLGYLVLAVRLPSDQLNKPVLGANYLHRKAVASILADAILDQARAFFVTKLKALNTKLNNEEHIEIPRWFSDIEETAKQAGLLWLVSRQQAGDFLGDPDAIEVVKRLNADEFPNRDEVEQRSDVAIQLIKLQPPVKQIQHIVRLDLPNSKYQLWLGVERSGFKEELSFSSPWETFLRSYGEIADAGLVRFTAVQEFQKLQIEAAQYQGLATIAVTMGTLAHQLTNMARNQAAACSTLKNTFDTGTVKVNGSRGGITNSDISELIASMKWSADEHMNLLTLFTKVTKVDDRRPCSLLEAVQQAVTLFRTALLQNEIRVNLDVDACLRIDVPFYVAALALGNLIGNAKDEMEPGKSISITAWEEEAGVVCKITDTGKGVDPKVAPGIFNLGVTTKPHSGGWGLYLVKRSLLENGANIELTETGPGGTTFVVWFPLPQVGGSSMD
jgi:signal transduction histidine kinase